MKALERQTEGYDGLWLATLLRRTSFASSFFHQPVPVRGVCFAAGPDSSQLARSFAEDRLGLGTFSIPPEAGDPKTWKVLRRLLTHPRTAFQRVGILLPDVDGASSDIQAQVAEIILATDRLLWFPVVSDVRKLLSASTLPLVVYLGLRPHNRMRVLLQSGQQLQIDRGSHKKCQNPSSN